MLVNTEVLRIVYVIYNRSNHFIMKGLAKEFKGEFNCLRENT